MKKFFTSVPVSRQRAFMIHFILLILKWPTFFGIVVVLLVTHSNVVAWITVPIWILLVIIERGFKLVSEYKTEDEKERGILLNTLEPVERGKGA